MIDLQPIKDRIAEASPWPWTPTKQDDIAGGQVYGADGLVVCEMTFDRTEEVSDANANFIANAPHDLAALVAEVERLRDAISRHRHVYVAERTKEWETESWAALDEADRKLWSAIDA